MDLVIKIIGYIGLAGLVLVGLLCAFLGWHWRALKAALKNATTTPLTVKLRRDPEPSWFADKAARKGDADMRRLGYEFAGAFTIDEMPGVQLVGYCHKEFGIYGAYYNHPAAGRWFDLCADFVDGGELTVTNAPQGEQLDHRPGTEKHFRKGDTIDALHAFIADRVSPNPVTPVAIENFAGAFEAAYAREMAWRSARNGISEEEFRRVAATTEHGLAPERWSEAYDETKLQEIQLWESAALDEFEKMTTLSVAEWKKFEGSMLIFRDDFHAPAYVAYLGESLGLEVEATERHRESVAHGLSLRGCLARMAEEAKVAWRELGQVERPQALTIIGYEQLEESSVG